MTSEPPPTSRSTASAMTDLIGARPHPRPRRRTATRTAGTRPFPPVSLDQLTADESGSHRPGRPLFGVPAGLSMTGDLLQQGACREGRDRRPAKHSGGVRGPARRREGRGPDAARRRRPGLRRPAPVGRSPQPDLCPRTTTGTGSTAARAPPSRTRPRPPPSSRRVGPQGLLQRVRQRHRAGRLHRPVRQGRQRLPDQRQLGGRRSSRPSMGDNAGFFLMPGDPAARATVASGFSVSYAVSPGPNTRTRQARSSTS